MATSGGSSELKVNFADPDMFGKDAAETENSDIFRSYAYERNEVQKLASLDSPLIIVRAFKGEGKSALLRIVKDRVGSATSPASVVVSKVASELISAADTTDTDHWTRAWKTGILGAIAAQIGVTVGHAWTDDTMRLVEEAERSGDRAYPLLKAIASRMEIQVEGSGFKLKSEGRTDLSGPVSRYLTDASPLWVFIDDIDLNFSNTPVQRSKIASLFTACRYLVERIPRLLFRLAVRPNVWIILKREFEALTHVEEFAHDLTWDEDDLRSLLFRRIEGHFTRRGKEVPFQNFVDRTSSRSENESRALSLVFESPMNWGAKQKAPHAVLATMSRHRPRWLMELCKAAAIKCVATKDSKITIQTLNRCLADLGNRRINDTVAEYKAHCGQLEEIITAFNGTQEEFETKELYDLLERKVVHHVPVQFSTTSKPGPREIAALLYYVGFITGRRELEDGGYEHTSFATNPSLFVSRANPEQGMTWEIHPVFRQALGLRDDDGRPLRRRTGKER